MNLSASNPILMTMTTQNQTIKKEALFNHEKKKTFKLSVTIEIRMRGTHHLEVFDSER